MATKAKGLFGSSIARKYWMAATGLFLCLFLLGHLAGNLQLLLPAEEGSLQFNAYAKFMTTNPAVKILSYVTYLSIVLHAIDGFILTRQNRAARPEKYAMEKASANSSWASRSMALLGTLTLVFIIIHMKSFWYEMHFGALPMDTDGNKDLYLITAAAFTNVWYTLFYVVAMAGLAFHLSHGFASAFQSLGLNHPKYNGIIKGLGKAFSILVPVAFAIIPLYLYLNQ